MHGSRPSPFPSWTLLLRFVLLVVEGPGHGRVGTARCLRKNANKVVKDGASSSLALLQTVVPASRAPTSRIGVLHVSNAPHLACQRGYMKSPCQSYLCVFLMLGTTQAKSHGLTQDRPAITKDSDKKTKLMFTKNKEKDEETRLNVGHNIRNVTI